MNLIFLHGAYEKNYCWNYFACRINSDRCSPYFLEYNIEEPVEDIIKNLKNQIIKHVGSEEFIIIGHSYGGVLAFLIGQQELPKQAKHIVTIASPLGGIEFNAYSPTAAISITLHDNHFWSNINPHHAIYRKIKNDSVTVPTLCVVRETKKTRYFMEPVTDNVVTVKSQKFLGERNNVTYACIDGSHVTALLDDRVVDTIFYSCQLSDLMSN